MIRITKTILFVVLICLVVAHFAGHTGGKPWWPVNPPAGNVLALCTYNVDAPPAIADSAELRTWCKDNNVEIRFMPVTAQFSADEAEFKALMALPRSADEWLYVKGRRSGSEALPKDEASAEKFIGRYR